MLCDNCGKRKATVHLTEIVNGQATEMHLCEKCAAQKSLELQKSLDIGDVLAGLAGMDIDDASAKESKLVCPGCGLSYEQFKKSGRLGCSQCYRAFDKKIQVLLKRIHGSNHYVGKAPSAISRKQDKDSKVQDLKMQLEKAIQLEDYEKAAELRDEIKKLEAR